MSRPSISRGFSDTLLAAVLVMAVAIGLAIGVASDVRGDLIGEFDLKTGTFANAVLSSNMTMTGEPLPTSGNFTASGWTWSGATSPGTGLRLENLPVTFNGTFSQYTIAAEFDFGQVSSYRRLMLLTPNDSGLYVNSGKFEIVGYSPPGNFSGNITANNKTNIVVTRTSTGNVTVYQVSNPESPTPDVDPLFTFTDGSNIMVSPGNGTMEFFRDDGSDFSISGNASLIKIWDTPLTPEEVAFAFVPEPSTVALLAVAGGGAVLYLHRRRRRLR